jgi:REP element-mobilizing transposase RayT
VHLVWGTWDRLDLITPELEESLYPAVISNSKALKYEALAVGGTPDHVHILARLAPSISVADLVKQIKGSTSHLITHKIDPESFFKWQGAYRAFTVSKSGVNKVRHYILNQKEHHQTGSWIAEWEFQAGQ